MPQRQRSFAEFLDAKKASSRRYRSESWSLFLSLYPEIAEYLQAGHNARSIWEYLHEEGVFTFSYITFLRHLARHKAELEKEAKAQVQNNESSNTNVSAAEKPPKEEEASGLDDNWEPLKSNRVEKKPFRVRTTPMTYEEMFPQDSKNK